jgi:hypothetical protein
MHETALHNPRCKCCETSGAIIVLQEQEGALSAVEGAATSLVFPRLAEVDQAQFDKHRTTSFHPSNAYQAAHQSGPGLLWIMANEASIAATNRSLRLIKAVSPPAGTAAQPLRSPILTFYLQELEFLTDSSLISPQQLSSILAQLPAQTQLHAPIHSPSNGTSPTPPVSHFSNINLNEKANYDVVVNPAAPPPAYASGPQILSIAVALYAYTPTDAGDLALQQNDRIQVTEHMNNDCKLRARDLSEDLGY